jgi:hypothetical protein
VQVSVVGTVSFLKPVKVSNLLRAHVVPIAVCDVNIALLKS